MARPVDKKKRAEIAKQALELIKTRGVHKITMSELASGLGMKRPTLYWYFPDLNALFEVVLLDIQQDVLVHVTTAMMEKTHPIDMLDALITSAAAYYNDKRDLVMSLVQLWSVASGGDAEPFLDLERKLLAPQREALIKLVEAGVAAEQVKPCDVEGLVDTVLTVADGCAIRSLAHGFDNKPMIEFVRRHVLRPLQEGP